MVAKDNQDRIGLAEIPGILGMDELIQSPRVQAAVVGRPVIHLRSIVDELDGLVGGDESSDRDYSNLKRHHLLPPLKNSKTYTGQLRVAERRQLDKSLTVRV